MSSETKLSREIRAELERLGIPVERIQSGVARGAVGPIKMASKGTPDLVTPYGWLEVKDESVPSKHQLAWHARWRAHGARVAVVTSVKEARETVIQWRKKYVG